MTKVNFKFLGVIFMASQLTTFAYGINLKRLEFEADTYHHRIQSNVLTDENMVKKSLCFLSDKEQIEKEYTQTESFLKFYNEVNEKIKEGRFLEFSNICKKIFEESDNDKDKFAVYLLLKKVKEKELKTLSSIEKLEEFKNRYEKTLKRDEDTTEALKFFLNIDKNIKNNSL